LGGGREDQEVEFDSADEALRPACRDVVAGYEPTGSLFYGAAGSRAAGRTGRCSPAGPPLRIRERRRWPPPPWGGRSGRARL